MKPVTKKTDKQTAFTIIELLTVMSIIVILIGLLLPSLNMAKRYAKEVRQRAQFHSIGAAMELFVGNSGWGDYPPSSAMDTAATPVDYCGAQKLCEAMMGQDLAGFHPESRFLSDATDGTSKKLYDTGSGLDPTAEENLKLRKGPYLQTENTSAYRLNELYPDTKITVLRPSSFVLCDVYNRVRNRTTGRGVGMPILYYKANKSNTIHDPNGTSGYPTATGDASFIYNYMDNDTLVKQGAPWDTAAVHPIDAAAADPEGPRRFYEMTRDKRVSITTGWPYRPDSYILLSAGFDGLYGTDDDIFNFDRATGQ